MLASIKSVRTYQDDGNSILSILKFVSHSAAIIKIAIKYGWMPAARYTNLRDVKTFDRLGFLDIDWKNYNYEKHLKAAELTNPVLTVARDIEDMENLERIVDQAYGLAEYAEYVVLVPKDSRFGEDLNEVIPEKFIIGFSVPSRYGRTRIPASHFKRPVHLLGGRPDIQRKLGDVLQVFSLDCNRFTLDAAYGDYFDGEAFRPHPKGGYIRCVKDSIRNITSLWESYRSEYESSLSTNFCWYLRTVCWLFSFGTDQKKLFSVLTG